jgi:hypothetical protein
MIRRGLAGILASVGFLIVEGSGLPTFVVPSLRCTRVRLLRMSFKCPIYDARQPAKVGLKRVLWDDCVDHACFTACSITIS